MRVSNRKVGSRRFRAKLAGWGWSVEQTERLLGPLRSIPSTSMLPMVFTSWLMLCWLRSRLGFRSVVFFSKFLVHPFGMKNKHLTTISCFELQNKPLTQLTLPFFGALGEHERKVSHRFLSWCFRSFSFERWLICTGSRGCTANPLIVCCSIENELSNVNTQKRKLHRW